MKPTTKRPPRLKNLTRYDSKRVHGWLVRFKRRQRAHWKWFVDSAHGGRAGALRAALAYRKQTLLRLPPPLRITRRGVRNTTGVVGVHLDWSRGGGRRKRYSYRAWWPDASGGFRRRGFSVEKYGEAEALRLAAKARREGIKALEEAKRQELVREIGPQVSLSRGRKI